jgi:hypothetical protein
MNETNVGIVLGPFGSLVAGSVHGFLLENAQCPVAYTRFERSLAPEACLYWKTVALRRRIGLASLSIPGRYPVYVAIPEHVALDLPPCQLKWITPSNATYAQHIRAPGQKALYYQTEEACMQAHPLLQIAHNITPFIQLLSLSDVLEQYRQISSSSGYRQAHAIRNKRLNPAALVTYQMYNVATFC